MQTHRKASVLKAVGGMSFLAILISSAFFYRHVCSNAGRLLSPNEMVRGLLQTPSNCGGNSAALFTCGRYACLAKFTALGKQDHFDLEELCDLDKEEFSRETRNHWIANADFLVRRGSIDLAR